MKIMYPEPVLDVVYKVKNKEQYVRFATVQVHEIFGYEVQISEYEDFSQYTIVDWCNDIEALDRVISQFDINLEFQYPDGWEEIIPVLNTMAEQFPNFDSYWSEHVLGYNQYNISISPYQIGMILRNYIRDLLVAEKKDLETLQKVFDFIEVNYDHSHHELGESFRVESLGWLLDYLPFETQKMAIRLMGPRSKKFYIEYNEAWGINMKQQKEIIRGQKSHRSTIGGKKL